MAETLNLWVIYDHPRDFPDHYVARLHVNGIPTESTIQASELEQLREVFLVDMRLTCIRRDPSDDPVIVETWL